MKIERFEMERYQSLHWHEVDYDLSESGVTPMTIRDLLGPAADAEAFLATALGYPLSEGSSRGSDEHRLVVPGRHGRRTSRWSTGARRPTSSRLWALARTP